MSEFTAPVAQTDPITESALSRRQNTKSKLVALVAAGALLSGCGAEPTVSGKSLPAETLTSAEPAPTTTTPTTVETMPTTVPTYESTSATAEITTQQTLCDKADVLGITERLGAASCAVAKDDGYFTEVIDGAHWQSGAGATTVKVIKDPNGTQFGKMQVVNVQAKERAEYGLQDYNLRCAENVCYTLQEENQVYGTDVVYEVDAGSRADSLALLGRLVNGDN